MSPLLKLNALFAIPITKMSHEDIDYLSVLKEKIDSDETVEFDVTKISKLWEKYCNE